MSCNLLASSAEGARDRVAEGSDACRLRLDLAQSPNDSWPANGRQSLSHYEVAVCDCADAVRFGSGESEEADCGPYFSPAAATSAVRGAVGAARNVQEAIAIAAAASASPETSIWTSYARQPAGQSRTVACS